MRADGSVEPLVVQIGAPFADPQDDDPETASWWCSFLLRAGERRHGLSMGGVDAFQALIHTLGVLALEIRVFGRKLGGTVAWPGDDGEGDAEAGEHEDAELRASLEALAKNGGGPGIEVDGEALGLPDESETRFETDELALPLWLREKREGPPRGMTTDPVTERR